MPITHFFAGVPTADLKTSLAWYERFFGAAPDRFPNDREAVWQLTDTALVYVVADADRAGRALVTLIVDDLQDWLDELTGRGIAQGDLDAMPGVAQRVTFVDPDGNTITVAQLLGSGSAAG